MSSLSVSDWINAHKWRKNIASPVNRKDLQRFQAGLDSIVGVEPDGTKRWRVVWGQDIETTRVWDRYLNDWVPRYRWHKDVEKQANPTTGLIEDRTTWTGVPRYFVEALIPKVHRSEPSEEKGRDVDGDKFSERRIEVADYVTMFCVCQHSPRAEGQEWRPCCLERMHQKKTCYGNYRVPDEADLDMLREDFHERVVSKVCRPDERISDADKQFFYTAWALSQAREAQKRADELDYRRNHIIRSLLPWRTTDFTSRKNRYSIPGV